MRCLNYGVLSRNSLFMKRILSIITALTISIICDAQTPSKGNNGLYGYVQDGDLLIPYKYEYALDFKEGLAGVCLSSRFGFIDNAGNQVIPLEYKDILAAGFTEGVCGVSKNGKKWYYIDKKGNKINDKLYSLVTPYHEGLAAVGIDNEVVIFVDKQGNKAIDAEFVSAEPFYDGIAVAAIYDKSRTKLMYGFIDKDGKWLSPSFYDEIYSEGDMSPFAELGVAKVKRGGKIGYVNRQMLFFDSLQTALASNAVQTNAALPEKVTSVKETSMKEASVTNVVEKPRVYIPSTPSQTVTSSTTVSTPTIDQSAIATPAGAPLSEVDQNSEYKQKLFLGAILSYDLIPDYIEAYDTSGGFTVGLGAKMYHTDNIFTWCGLAFNGFYASSTDTDKYTTEQSSYTLRLPLNVGLSFFKDQIVEISTGPCFSWCVGGQYKELLNGKELNKLDTSNMKTVVQWNVVVTLGIFRCGLLLPLTENQSLELSIGIGF